MPVTRRAALALPLLALPGLARAQGGFPDRPLRFICPFAPGGNADVTSRILAPPLAEALGQPVVVENRAGAGGSVAALALARMRPDGYSFMIGSNGPLTGNPAIQPNLGYDPLRDFSFIGLVCRTPLTIVVKKDLPAADLREFIAHAKARPGAVSAGSSGVGSTAHLAIEAFNGLAGVELQHIPFGSGGAMAPNLISGAIDAAVTEVSTALPLHRDGQARILAIATARRSTLAPDIPTVEEASGLSPYREAAFLGLMAPAGTPPEVLAKLGGAMRQALALAETRRRFAEVGSEVAEPEEQTPQGFRAFLEPELARIKALAVKAGLRQA